MGGIVYLNDGKPAGRGNVCLSSYEKGTPHYALSNFYPGDDGKGFDFHDADLGQAVHFPTAEHFLHFSKLTQAAKKQHLTALQGMSASQVLEWARKIPATDIQPGAVGANWFRYRQSVQMQINATKYAASKKFKDSIDTAYQLGTALDGQPGAAVIIEDTSSAQRQEKYWGTDTDGQGENILGTSQTAFANLIHDKALVQSILPTFDECSTKEFKDAYSAAVAQYNAFQPALTQVRQAAKADGQAPQKDTTELDAQYVQAVTFQGGQLAHGNFQQAGDSKAPAKQAEAAKTQSASGKAFPKNYKTLLDSVFKNGEDSKEGRVYTLSNKAKLTVTNNSVKLDKVTPESAKDAARAYILAALADAKPPVKIKADGSLVLTPQHKATLQALNPQTTGKDAAKKLLSDALAEYGIQANQPVSSADSSKKAAAEAAEGDKAAKKAGKPVKGDPAEQVAAGVRGASAKSDASAPEGDPGSPAPSPPSRP